MRDSTANRFARLGLLMGVLTGAAAPGRAHRLHRRGRRSLMREHRVSYRRDYHSATDEAAQELVCLQTEVLGPDPIAVSLTARSALNPTNESHTG